MLLQFSCLRNVRHRGTSSMLKSIICVLMLSSSLLAQTYPTAETIKKDVQALQNAAKVVAAIRTLNRLELGRAGEIDKYKKILMHEQDIDAWMVRVFIDVRSASCIWLRPN